MKKYLLVRIAATILGMVATLPSNAADQHINGPAPGSGPYMVFAHYMPCYFAYGYNPDDPYWYAAPIAPQTNVRSGITARPILGPIDRADPALATFVADIKIAKQYGLDGFLVDELGDDDSPGPKSYRKTWRTLLKAAEIVGDFKIGIMPDFATLKSPLERPDSRVKIKSWVDIGLKSPAFLTYDGKPVVFPYGATSPSPNGRLPTMNNELVSVALKRELVDWFADQGQPIAFAPSVGVWSKAYEFPYLNDPEAGIQTMSFAAGSFTPMMEEKLYDRQLAYWPKSLMLMGENAFLYYNRGWKYSNGDMDVSEYYRRHWEYNITHRDRYRWLMLVTWNDWGETGIGPSDNHFMAWQPITRYYADWFKTGKQPEIKQDIIEILHRPHPYDAKPTLVDYQVQTAEKVQFTKANDVVEAIAFLTKPATIVIQTGDQTFKKDVPAGPQAFKAPFSLGIQSARIERRGKTVASTVSPVPIADKTARQNLWYIGADSAHPPRPVAMDKWADVTGKWTGAGDKRTGSGLTQFGNMIELSDSSITAKVAPPAAGEAGVVLQATEDGKFLYGFSIKSAKEGNRWQITKRVSGADTVLIDGPVASGAHTLRFDIVGDYRIGYIDGKTVGQVADWPNHKLNKYVNCGQCGLWATGGDSDFSRISVMSYDPDVK
ncbi:MAG TPA: endo-1,3-alpha-glucanase family glycosylhydrolase [Capsulimonadaceae bacterium]|jgi:glucan endo-1,3-alpha-glucosidase